MRTEYILGDYKLVILKHNNIPTCMLYYPGLVVSVIQDDSIERLAQDYVSGKQEVLGLILEKFNRG